MCVCVCVMFTAISSFPYHRKNLFVLLSPLPLSHANPVLSSISLDDFGLI